MQVAYTPLVFQNFPSHSSIKEEHDKDDNERGDDEEVHDDKDEANNEEEGG